MVPNVIERVWVQGTTTKVESLRGTAFTEENGAHTFRIAGVDASGETVPLSGTVLAKILRADNITIDVSGTITDGVASVTMVGDCYHVPGRFSIVVYLSDGVTTIAIYAAVGDIYRATSDTELDSGTTVPSLVQLEAAYQNALSAAAAANTAATGAERVNVSMSKSGDTITFSATDRTGATTTATMSDQSEEVASLNSAIINEDRKINVINGISENPYEMQLLWTDVWKTIATRIYTNELPIIGYKLVIATSNDYIFAPLQRDNTNTYAGWSTSWETDTSALTNGLMLWIKKADGTDFTDAEFKDAIDNTTISYYLDITKKVAFVAPSGNDTTGDGSESNPYATINRAIKDNAGKIILEGGKYKQAIALPASGIVNICAKNSNTFPVIYGANALEITTPTLHGNGIYKYSTTFSQAAYTPWIFQDGIPDATTEIHNSEKLPQQKSQQYRCTDTIIKRCSSNNLSDALTEIANSMTPLFYYDSSEHMVYFKPVATTFSINPIIIPADEALFSNGSSAVTLIISGVFVKYTRFDISHTSNSVITDCKVTGAYASSTGLFTYDDAINPTFINCEAGMAHSSSGYGDGFNSHNTNSGDTGAIRTGARLLNCWSHDNMDDGYSDHYQGYAEIIGGLYEYNGKGGITPSYSTNCVCRDVIVRQNYNGFYITGDGNKLGRFMAFNCISENNMRGGDTHYHAGFFVSDNDAAFYNCISINNKTAFIGMKSTDKLKLIDCKSSGDERQTRGSGVFEKIVGTVISD